MFNLYTFKKFSELHTKFSGIKLSRVENVSDFRAEVMLTVVVFTFHSKAVFVFLYNLNIKISSFHSILCNLD